MNEAVGQELRRFPVCKRRTTSSVECEVSIKPLNKLGKFSFLMSRIHKISCPLRENPGNFGHPPAVVSMAGDSLPVTCRHIHAAEGVMRLSILPLAAFSGSGPAAWMPACAGMTS